MNSPIGIFDSGLGGLTVFREIAKHLPSENLIYVGDTARVPYGIKSAETVIRYSREICDFLIEKGVKGIVVACNTASAFALPQLQEKYSIPILGVLEPGVQAAIAASRSHSIGVIGTEGTIKSESYLKAIQKKLPEARVISKPCPLFVPLVEEGWIQHEVTRQVAEIYLGEWRKGDLDTLILGCTHYPLLKPVLREIFGERVSLVDSAEETAKALHQLLNNKGLLTTHSKAGAQQFFTTDIPQKLSELARRFLGHELVKVEQTDLGMP